MLFVSGIKLVILDFDGVIVESNDIKDQALRKIFNRYPDKFDELWQYHRTHVSLSRYAKFDYLLEKIGQPGNLSLKNKLLADFSETTLKLMKSVSFVAGAKYFLQDMEDRLPLYLASVTPIEDLAIILDNLNIRSFFKEIYGCPPWNKMDAIRDILVREDASPQEAVLIGDSYGDQRAALETGIHFIGRDSGLGFEEPLPAFIIPDLVDAAKLFKN